MRKIISLLLSLLLLGCLLLPVSASERDSRQNAHTEEEAEQSEALDPRIEAMLDWAVGIAEDDSHGYSQAYRLGPCYDCTSFVSTALMEGGFEIETCLSTGGMLQKLPEFGFVAYRRGETEAQKGDILIRLGTHAEICMGDGGCVAAHQDYDGYYGDSSGHEIEYRRGDASYGCPFCRYQQYNYIIRYEGPAPKESGEAETLETGDFEAFLETDCLILVINTTIMLLER